MSVERPSGDLGRKLREARERKGVSLRQIANKTKIAVAVLDGLERNDISKLPGGIFGRAFVRSFAAEVGLDPESAIKEFISQFRDDSVAVGHPLSDQIEDNEALETRRRQARTLLGLIALGLAIVAVIAYLRSASDRFPSFARARQTPAEVTSAASVAPSVPQDTSAVPSSSQPAASGTASLATGTSERPATRKPPGDSLAVTLTVTRRCWVAATADGVKQIWRLMMPGDEGSLEVHRELELTVGDAGAVMMTINGVEASALGKGGEVKTVRLNLANFTTFLPAR
jgi:cytoskeletal protein RodZ